MEIEMTNKKENTLEMSALGHLVLIFPLSCLAAFLLRSVEGIYRLSAQLAITEAERINIPKLAPL